MISSHRIGIVQDNESISEDAFKNAFLATENEFLGHVCQTRHSNPLISASGSCCLVGVIWGRTLYIANAGDSRAIIGCLSRSNNIIAEQLTSDHNASKEEVRDELRSLHPDDPHIVFRRNGAWRVKGIIQVYTHSFVSQISNIWIYHKSCRDLSVFPLCP